MTIYDSSVWPESGDRGSSDGGMVFGSICGGCGFDEAVISFDLLPNGASLDQLRVHQPMYEHTGHRGSAGPGPAEGVWCCTGCLAVHDAGMNVLREHTTLLRRVQSDA
jgi:hypothetical protein